MLSALIVVFREVLEAALVLGIVCAATRGIRYRGLAVGGGIVLGITGAAIVAFSAEVLSGMAEGMGQEIFNALVLLTVVVMLAWHNIWMSVHGAEMAASAVKTGASVREGAKPLTVLVVLVGLAVLREGSEIVLFLYGIATGGASAGVLATGSALGLLAGTLVGFALYAGLLRVPMRYFFAVTGVMLMLLAAGMASQAAKFLVQADFLPAWGYHWDTSAAVDNGSLTGQLMGTLIGYDARPAGMQVAFYLATVAVIFVGTKVVHLITERRTCRHGAIGAVHH
jgi:high-affinity iron transporter